MALNLTSKPDHGCENLGGVATLHPEIHLQSKRWRDVRARTRTDEAHIQLRGTNKESRVERVKSGSKQTGYRKTPQRTRGSIAVRTTERDREQIAASRTKTAASSQPASHQPVDQPPATRRTLQNQQKRKSRATTMLRVCCFSL